MGYVGKVSVDGGTTEHLVGSTLYGVMGGTCATRTVSCSDFDALVEGVTIFVKCSSWTSSSTQTGYTLNVNGTGAKSVSYQGASLTTTSAQPWVSGEVLPFTYNGTSWCINGSGADVRSTAGSSNSTSKLFLVGATSQSSAGVQTYSNTGVYATNGALVCGTINTGNGAYEINAAAEKAIGSVASGDTGLVTGSDVYTAIQNAISGQAQFMGTLGTSGATYTQAQLEALAYTSGMYFVCSTSGTFVGQTCEAGDMVWCVSDKGSAYSASDFSVVQENIDTISNAEIDTIVAS